MCRYVFLLLGLLFASLSQASEFFNNRGGHSLTALFGVPGAFTADIVDKAGAATVTLNHVNMFAGGNRSNEHLLLDAERTELTLAFSRPLGVLLERVFLNRTWAENWYATFRLPLVAHGGGFLDQPIEEWHDWFDLPNGNREDVPRDEVAIEYIDPLGQVTRLESSNYGVGDTVLEFARPLGCRACSNPAIRPIGRVGFKLPSGNESKLLGSGNVDVYADLTSSLLRFGEHGFSRVSVGMLYSGKSRLFSNQESLVIFGFTGLGYQWSRRTDLILQVDWHTPMFDSGLKELGRMSARLTAGFAMQLDSGRVLELGLQEDLTPDTSPDVGLFLRVRRQH